VCPPYAAAVEKTLLLSSGAQLHVRGADDEGTLTNADVELVDEKGGRWSATVLTLDAIAGLMESWRTSGECQSGAFFRVPDLVIVRDPSFESVAEVFTELHRSDEYRHELNELSG
jgi:hypothetical protein